MWKKVLFVLCAALMVAAFAACGGRDDGKTQESPSPSPSQSATTTPDTETKSEYAKAVDAANFKNYQAVMTVEMAGTVTTVETKVTDKISYVKGIVTIAGMGDTVQEIYYDSVSRKYYVKGAGASAFTESATDTTGLSAYVTLTKMFVSFPESDFTKSGSEYTMKSGSQSGVASLKITIANDKVSKVVMSQSGMDYDISYSNYGSVTLTLPTV